ncbi:MAG: hypothetical protein PHP92_05540 [Candidatus Nanoarchaeia archaeon]|nr:hypothetical protein [Candidatus Nanoarchaeia archaeon]
MAITKTNKYGIGDIKTTSSKTDTKKYNNPNLQAIYEAYKKNPKKPNFRAIGFGNVKITKNLGKTVLVWNGHKIETE